MATKLNIHSVLEFFDEGNLGVYEALREDPEMLKELEKNVTWMLPQWMSSAANSTAHAELINNFNTNCNNGWFELYGHPELQAKLLATCGTGKPVKHKYYKPTVSKNLRLMTELLSHKYEDIHGWEVEMWVRRSEKADVIHFAESLGYQRVKVKELVKAFDTLRKG